MTAFFGSSFKISLAMRPMRAAPAVWELEGPIMTGPTTSKTPMRKPP